MLLIGFPEAVETQTLILRETDPRGAAADTNVSPQRSYPHCPGAGSSRLPPPSHPQEVGRRWQSAPVLRSAPHPPNWLHLLLLTHGHPPPEGTIPTLVAVGVEVPMGEVRWD